jgi:uncharacterized tellurite resistance protein B-like protein
MEDHFYNKETMNAMMETIHNKFTVIDGKLDAVIAQTTRTNGRVNKLEKYMMVVSTVTATLLFTSGSELIGFIMKII